MTPEEALAEITLLDGARVVSVLAGGPASNSYLVECGADRFVLRIDTEVAAVLGLDRSSESKILAYVHRHGLGSKPEFVDTERGILVTRYVEGRAWVDADMHAGDQRRKLVALLRILHSLKPVGPPFDLQKKIESYACLIDTDEAHELANGLKRQLRALKKRSVTSCLCHNDLVCTNIIEGQRVSLIDWEYAAVGDPFFDLATIAEHHHLNEEESLQLLAEYCGRKSAEDVERLAACRELYSNLNFLWLASVERCLSSS